MLKAHSIVKGFGESQVLKGVSVHVVPGAFTVVVGPSGSGKTTLLRALSMLDPPDSGSIELDGCRYHFPDPPELTSNPPWPRVTVVFQQLFLWPHLTLRENILLPVRTDAGREAHLQELVGQFEMRDFVDRYPNEVSIGQRQRAALARAVITNPSYILLDEITSALDTEQTAAVLRYLLSLRDRGLGIVVVTHLLGFARRLLTHRESDTVFFLESGQVLESGGLSIFDQPSTERFRAFLAASSLVL